MDAEDVIATRLTNARDEIGHWREYDYVVINDDLDRAFPAVQAIVKAEVDLLWFGGIGTYIKASDESHAEAGD